MEILALESALEPIFWAHVKQDLPHYYFFALDWKYRRDATEILLALKDNRIDGMMLIYKRKLPRSHTVNLSGSSEAVESLLDKLDLEKVEMLIPERYEERILKKFKPVVSHHIMLMVLREGEGRLQMRHPIIELDTSYANMIASLMRETDPDFWGEASAEQVIENIGYGNSYFGIEVEGRLVSISGASFAEWGGLIQVVATQENHRNRGYATSLVSQSVKRILKKRSLAMIYVLPDNEPAVRVYSKVGFRPYRKYFYMRGEMRP